MPISDDDGEPVLQSVTDYHFVDDKSNVISFFVLPFELGKDERVGGTEKAIFLHGKADGGLQKIYKRVIRWKLDLSGEQHVISVLSMERCWIKLQKPRKSFEGTIRTILIIIYCLHFAKKNPNASWRSLWKHLDKVISLHEAIPSEGDLRHHLPLIRVMLRRDEALAKSKILHAFLENPKKCRMSLKDMQKVEEYKFIVDWEDMEEELENAVCDEYNDDPELFDSVCAICDNGGEILCCEGSCLRSFHATIEAGAESLCDSLRLSDAEVEAMQTFLCANCQYKQHQCFACGKLGSSDKSSGAAEVFSCVSATCGRFYHPVCVARLLHPGNEAKAKDHHKRIAAGEAFTCPIHKCVICKQGENKELEEMQFAICRRCPKGYHKKCLPRKISLRPIEEEHIIQRAWPGLIPNRLLIYCMKHEIEEDLGTPTRNHIIFPDVEKNRSRPLDLKSSMRKLISKRKGMFSGDASRDESDKKIRKETKKGSLTGLENHFMKKSEKSPFELGVDPSKKFKAPDASICFKDIVKPIFPRVDKSSSWKENKGSIRQNSTDSPPSMGLQAVKPKLKEICSSTPVMPLSSPIMKKSSNMSPLLDSESKNKIMNLIRKTSLSITLKDIMEKYNPPATQAYSSRNVEKTITQGKVKASVEAVRTALQKLKNGCSIEDAKAVCEPAILQQIINWKNKLNIYLAPFLHGMRYTSFGRHFTKVDKIKEIVDKIHWYVQNGDMMVDFCCGANDYSLLMRDKLEETGKKCQFKNYDLFQPKNDFNFEQRDWMTVLPQELPDGSQLIMGLNPPFGFKASLANKFIDKALEFKPKLIILIVPRETQRLDVKESCYDLIWEETMRLSGKSFYLPGSVDTNDKQLDQWNLKPPVLWLWSRPDWTPHHMAVAVKQGHTCKVQEEPFINQVETQFSDQWWKDHDFDDDMDISDDDLYAKNDKVKRNVETRTMVTEQQMGTTTPKHYTCHREEDGDGGRNGVGNMKKRDHENPGREYKVKQARTTDQHHISWPHAGVMLNAEMLSLSGGTTTRSLREGGPSEASETGNEEVLQPSRHGFSGSGFEFGTGHGGAPLVGFPGDLNYSFGLSSEAVYSSCPNASMTQQYGTCLNELNYSGQGLGSVNQLSSSFGVFRPPVVYPNTHATQQYTFTPQLPQIGGSIFATHGPWSDVQYPFPHQSSSGWNGK